MPDLECVGRASAVLRQSLEQASSPSHRVSLQLPLSLPVLLTPWELKMSAIEIPEVIT